jgi:nucleotide-binding universal stress UspA family protein
MTAFPRRVAIAWKNTAEASRAVTAAMPLLEQAERLIVITVREGPQDHHAASAEAVASQLRWHGRAAEVRVIDAADRYVPDVLLEGARAAGADLLVMGAYSRSRLRETVFGGVTAHVLKGVELPALMAH